MKQLLIATVCVLLVAVVAYAAYVPIASTPTGRFVTISQEQIGDRPGQLGMWITEFRNTKGTSTLQDDACFMMVVRGAAAVLPIACP